MGENFSSLAALIWSVADLLRGDFKQSQYGRIILPFTVLRRLECVLEPTKAKVIDTLDSNKKMKQEALERLLLRAAKHAFYNSSRLSLATLSNTQTLKDLENYINSFSKDSRDIFEHFRFSEYLAQLDTANLLFKVVQKFKDFDLSSKRISNHDMGLVFEELIRRFAESSNETAGEHFTPRDIVQLATSLVFMEDDAALSKPGTIKSIYDPTAGTGGFLSSGTEYVYKHNPNARIAAFGQELNPESYAICKADMLIKNQSIENIKLGNTLSNDQLGNKKFDYMLSNPPFGVEWKKVEKEVRDEHTIKGYDGRFGPGLPRVSDGSLLFLLHLISKMQQPGDKSDGSSIGIILNGSPLFTGGAGSGESEIRRYILESDLLVAIVALPTDMFFNTGIATYVWILSSHKPKKRKGKVQLINATNFYGSMRKSLGSKRKILTTENIKEITRIFGNYEPTKICKIFETQDFGYRRITVERPLRLSAKFTDEAIESLRYQPSLREHMQWAYEHFGDDLYINLKSYKEQIQAHLKSKEVKPKLQNEVLNINTWNTQKQLMEQATKLRKVFGNKQFDDFNVFEPMFTKKLKELDVSLDAWEKHQILDAITWKNPGAKRVIKRVHEKTKNRIQLYGYFPAENNKGVIEYEVDTDLRDYENVPLKEDIETYYKREVAPHVPDAWIDAHKRDEKDGQIGIVGYEIPFNRHFYKYEPPRSLEAIDADLDKVSAEIMQLLQEVHV